MIPLAVDRLFVSLYISKLIAATTQVIKALQQSIFYSISLHFYSKFCLNLLNTFIQISITGQAQDCLAWRILFARSCRIRSLMRQPFLQNISLPKSFFRGPGILLELNTTSNSSFLPQICMIYHKDIPLSNKILGRRPM